MRIAFSTLPAAGHLNPTLALARKVRQRGHDGFFLGLPDCEPEVRAAGFEFRVFAERQIPVGSRKELEAHLSKLHGVAGLNYTLNKLIELFEAVVLEAVPALREARADALVVDEALVGFVLVAAQLNLLVIHIANALPWYQCDSVPPPLTGWPYRTDTLGLLRNRIGYGAVRFFMRRFRVRVREHR